MVYPTASMLSENYNNNKQVAQEAVVLMPDGA
jgi:hypothetical protein